MGVLTNLLKLLKPGENDYYNQQTEQADNWDKVDNYAVLTNTDKNGIWGGEYGGKIQDPIPKELNKRYIDNINGKAFICIKAGDSSVVSNTIEYFTPCNVVDNLGKLQNLIKIKNEIKTSVSFRNTITLYSSDTLRGFKDSDMIYVICDTNNGGEGYAYIAPVSLFRNGPSGTRVTLGMLDATISNVRVSLGVVTNTGNLTLSCNVSADVYLRYACVISSVI